jgi:flagellar hook assembly protein FlgD
MTPILRTSPNPMTRSTEVSYRVLDREPIALAIFDATGRVVRTLTESRQTPGDHTLVWDGTDGNGKAAPSGVYFARLKTSGKTATARMVKLER